MAKIIGQSTQDVMHKVKIFEPLSTNNAMRARLRFTLFPIILLKRSSLLCKLKQEPTR